MSSEPTLKPGKYSMFVLNEDGTWKQPTVRIAKAITETRLKAAVLNLLYDRHHFDVIGIQPDEDCPEEKVWDLIDRGKGELAFRQGR